jgi:DNA topoisomerase-1
MVRVRVDDGYWVEARSMTGALSKLFAMPVSGGAFERDEIESLETPDRGGVKRDFAGVHGVGIPKGHKVFWTSNDPDGDARGMVAKAHDAKGRVVRYYAAWRKVIRNAVKWPRILKLLTVRDKIVTGIKDGMSSNDDARKQAFEALAVIAETGMRPGSEQDTGAKVQAFGATTLQVRHVRVDGDAIQFGFVGKHGVMNQQRATDPDAVAAIKRRLSRAGRPDAPLWPNVSAEKVRDALKDISPADVVFHPKDLRTALATRWAFGLVGDMRVPETEGELKKAKRRVAKEVSARLGNTPAVALESYIAPVVFEAWENAIRG